MDATPRSIATEMLRLSGRLDAVWDEYQQVAQDAAEKGAAHKKAWAQARLVARAKTQGDKNDLAEAETNDERLAYELAQAREEVLKMSQHNLRQQLNALTAVAYVLKSEVELAGRYSA